MNIYLRTYLLEDYNSSGMSMQADFKNNADLIFVGMNAFGNGRNIIILKVFFLQFNIKDLIRRIIALGSFMMKSYSN
jgi:hypothetical protein